MSDIQAKIILINFQHWRLGNLDEYPYTPKQITEALTIAIKNLK